MAYSPLPSKSDLDTLDITTYTAIKGNFEAGVPDIFTTKGDLAAATGADAAARLAVGAAGSELVPDSTQTTGLKWQIRPTVRVYLGSAFDPAVGSWDDVDFDSERWDTNAMHSPSTNPERLTVPTGADGVWTLGATVEFDTGDSFNGASIIGVRLLLDGTTDIGGTLINAYRAETIDMRLTVSSEWDMDATHYVTCQVYTSRDVNVLTAEFWATFRRPM